MVDLSKVQQLADKLQFEQIQELTRKGLNCQANINACKTAWHIGKKYIRLDIGTSGRYMIDEQGNIFGIKAYGVIHRGHNFGTLDTINNYYWGKYHAHKIY